MIFKMKSGRVRDRVQFDGDLILDVDSDAFRMMSNIYAAGEAISQLTPKSTTEDLSAAARAFAAAIFGHEQAKQLMDFYHGDATCVLNMCGKYFSLRLKSKITKAQIAARERGR